MEGIRGGKLHITSQPPHLCSLTLEGLSTSVKHSRMHRIPTIILLNMKIQFYTMEFPD
jgi:hypothetical protein